MTSSIPIDCLPTECKTSDCAEKAIIVKATGPRGKRGLMGPPGPAGIAGPRGCPGLEGAQGKTGERGPQGSQGPVGPQGRIGAQGEMGRRGPQGDPGPRGPPGSQILFGNGNPNGQPLPAHVGDIFIDRDTGDVWRLISNCPMVWVLEFNLKGPQGDVGAQGALGAQGLPGSQGSQGSSLNLDCSSDVHIGKVRVDNLDQCSSNGFKVNTVISHHVFGDFIAGAQGIPLTPLFTPGESMLWYQVGNASLQGGQFPGSGYNPGMFSISFGNMAQAPGLAATALGNQGIASGAASVTLGSQGMASGFASLVTGHQSTATASYATAMGEFTQSTAEAAMSIGRLTLASGPFSFASGHSTVASGTYTSAHGRDNAAVGDFSAVFGNLNVTNGQNSFALGVQNTTSVNSRFSFVGGSQSLVDADGAFAHGFKVQSTAIHADSFGASTIAAGDFSFVANEANTVTGRSAAAFGHNGRVSGSYGFGAGESTTVSGVGAAGFGINSQAVGEYSFTAGEMNVSGARGSASFGNSNQSTSPYSFVTGACSVAEHEASSALGIGLVTSAEGGAVVGRFNNPTCGEHLFEVGCGRSDSDRDTGFAVHTDCSSTFYHALEALGGLKVCGPLNADSLSLRGALTANQLKANSITAPSATINKLTVNTICKQTGTFTIPHPLRAGYNLVHSFVEAPTAGENIYRYSVKIDKEIKIDLPDYFSTLNSDPQTWISSTSTFGRGYGKIEGNILIVIVDIPDLYNILVVGTRKDPSALRDWKGSEVLKEVLKEE